MDKVEMPDCSGAPNIEDEYYSEDWVRGFLKFKNVQSMRVVRARMDRPHPHFIKIGRLTLYPKVLFQKWLNEQSLRGVG